MEQSNGRKRRLGLIPGLEKIAPEPPKPGKRLLIGETHSPTKAETRKERCGISGAD
jgi:hypothetical protein